MADIRAEDLTEEILSTLSGTEYFVMFDNVEGKKALLSVISDYIATHGEINGEDIPTLLTAIGNKIGTLSNLSTTVKTNLVAAINEVKGETTDLKEDLENLEEAVDENVLAIINPINIWNPEGTGYYNRYGTYYSSVNQKYMFINVSEGDVFRVYNWGTYDYTLKYVPSESMRLCAYNGNTAIPSIDVTNASSYTVPSGVTKLCISLDITRATDGMITLNTEEIPLTHQSYFEPYIAIKTDKTLTQENRIADAKATGEAIKLAEQNISNFEVIMPSRVPVVVGSQLNIYNDNIIFGDIESINYIDYSVSSFALESKMLQKNIQINPQSAKNQLSYVYVKNKKTNEILKSKSFWINAINPLATSKKVIFIGDSLTDIGYYPAEIEHNLSNGNIQSIGTRSRTVEIEGQTLTSLNEGRSGWSPYDYVTKSNVDNVINAFWNPNTNKFDFSYYMSTNNFVDVDCVCIALGTNGTVNTEECVDSITEMINSIHLYDSNIIILVTLITPGAKQDGWGNLLHTTSADNFKYTQMKLVKAYMEAFEEVITNVHVVPWYLNLDSENDFPTDTYPLSSRNPTIVTMQSNNVHPSIYGYLKMADVMWASLSYYLS